MPHYLYQLSELGKHDCVPYLLGVYRNIIITSSRYMCTCVWVNLMMIVYSHSVHVCGQSVIMSHSFAVCVGQRRVMQYSAMDQTQDSINELCFSS